jgi:hypothetical protein
MKKIIVFWMLIFCIGSQIQAQSKTGMDVYRACNSIIKQAEGKEVSISEQFETLYWVGYLSGLNDTAVLYSSLLGKGLYCPPEQGIQVEQIAMVVHKYLKDNPKDLHQTARVSLIVALKDAFPCTSN